MTLTGKRIFITGGGGFIGTNLCARLVEDNQLVIYDNGRRDAISYTGPGLSQERHVDSR